MQRIRISIRVIEIERDRVRADSEEVHTMRYFFPLELDLALRSHGFHAPTLTGYPDINKPVSAKDWLAAFAAAAL